MAEVVQDLLDHVTRVGGAGHRRADAVRGLGPGTPAPRSMDCAVVAEASEGAPGPQVECLQDLVFDELLDKPSEEKTYRMQLKEFAYRGERIIKQIDEKLSVVERMVWNDFLSRSQELPQVLRGANDELRHAHLLICNELEDVWHMQFLPFFYPSEDEEGPASPGRCPGGWLDLDDMFLTARTLVRYMIELVKFIGTVVHTLPDDLLASRPQFRSRPPDPALHQIVATFAARVPWIGVSLPAEGKCHVAVGAVLETSLLDKAIAALDSVLTLHMRQLQNDLHRTMYRTFVRICGAYARWKCTLVAERERALRRGSVQQQGTPRRTRRSVGGAPAGDAPGPARPSPRARRATTQAAKASSYLSGLD